jgi:hypothetical protein
MFIVEQVIHRVGAMTTAARALPTSKKWPADKVERWPIDRLTPYAHNGSWFDERVA